MAIGLCASVYLTISHYRNFTDIGYQSFCAVSQSMNCDTVSQSVYAIFWNVPLGVWGITGYLVFLMFMVLLFPGKDSVLLRVWASGLCLLAGIFSAVSLVLAGIAAFKIHSYCLMCIVLYGVNFLLLYVSWLVLRRSEGESHVAWLKVASLFFKARLVRLVLIGAGFGVVCGTLVFFFPRYWLFPALGADAAIRFGVTEDGSPWIGAEKPVLTIEEYADYMCFQCGKMHSHLRQLVNQYPDRIRLVHRHFPLDDRINPVIKEKVHPNSGIVAVFAIAAQDAGVFWQVNDLLFRDAREKGKIPFHDISSQAGWDKMNLKEILKNRIYMEKLEKDIQEGLRLGITATPSYVIDGKVHAGTIPDSVLRSAFP